MTNYEEEPSPTRVNMGWTTEEFFDDSGNSKYIHVVPILDLVEHTLDFECVCGTVEEHYTQPGATPESIYLISHSSLDNREAEEENYNE